MIICPNCKKQLEDGVKFCDGCGASIPEMVFCPQCGKKTSAVSSVCQQCGTIISESSDATTAPNTETTPKKKFPKKAILFSAISLVVVVAILTIVLVLSHKNSSAKYGLYIKDDNLYFTDLSNEKPFQVTVDLIEKASDSSFSGLESVLSYYCRLGNDHQTMFYPDKLDFSENGFALYYRDISDQEGAGNKIDSDVLSYTINESATLVIYMKGDDRILYQYDMEKAEKEKIAKNVSRWTASDNGELVYFLDNEAKLYLIESGKEKEKLDSDVNNIVGMTSDFSTVLYLRKDNILYKKEIGEDKEKITEDVDEIISACDTGELFFTKKETNTVKMSDYVFDDMKDVDEALQRPEEPEWPSRWDFDSSDEYEKAYEAYEADLDKYYDLLNEYRKKESRDELREEIVGNDIELSSYSLFYYDGNEIIELTDSFVKDSDYYSSYTPIIVFKTYDNSEIQKVNISDVSSIYEIRDYLSNTESRPTITKVSIKDTAISIESSTADTFMIDKNGNSIFYFDDYSNDGKSGDLYRIAVSNYKPQEPELYDTDVDRIVALMDDQVFYLKNYDVDSESGELFHNKNKIDDDVYAWNCSYHSDENSFAYFVDWDEDNSCGTLKVYDGKESVSVSGEVQTYDFSPDGSILYLYDYSKKNKEGELYVYNNGESLKIDDEVYAIVPSHWN